MWLTWLTLDNRQTKMSNYRKQHTIVLSYVEIANGLLLA